MFAQEPQGVRAQPKALRPQTAISNISSYLGGISAYVAQNLPDKLQWNPSTEAHGLEDVNSADFGSETVAFAKFCWISWPLTSHDPAFRKKKLYLFLGYQAGFQIWDVSDADNVQEVLSLRQGFGKVHCIEAVPDIERDAMVDKWKSARPLVALIVDKSITAGNPMTDGGQVLRLFSMQSLSTVHTLDFEADEPVDVKCTPRVIAVALASQVLNIYSTSTMDFLAKFTDVLASPLHSIPVFDIGLRYIIYATSAAPPTVRRGSPTSADPDSDDAEVNEESGLARKMAGKVAKDLVVGAKVIGEYGYQALSNYFSHAGTKIGETMVERGQTLQRDSERSMARSGTSPRSSSQTDKSKSPGAVGAVIICSLPLDKSTANASAAIAHWKPHSNPVSVACFNPSQTIALTASVQANTFYLWEVPGRSSSGKVRAAVRCLYKLERGYTAATIEHIGFSWDSRWIGVTTAKGTTHIYKIDPFAGRDRRTTAINGTPDERLNLINGLTEPRATTSLNTLGKGTETIGGVASLYPIARVKRHHPSEPRPGHKLGTAEADELPDSLSGSARAWQLAAFLPAEKQDKINASRAYNSTYSRRPSSDRSSPSASVTGSWGSPRGSTLEPSTSHNATTTRIYRQRILTFQSTDRDSLMIHHVDVILEHSGSTHSPTSPATHLPTPQNNSDGRSTSPMERFSPSSLLSNAFPGLSSVLGTGSRASHHVRVKITNVMEWNVKRDKDWAEVQRSIGMPQRSPNTACKGSPKHSVMAAQEHPSPGRHSTNWASKIEIRSYHPSLRPPVWMGPQFVFQVYDKGRQRMAASTTVVAPDLSDLPPAMEVQVKREAPKPHSNGRTGPSSHLPTLHSGDKIQENLSTAMDSPIEINPLELSMGHRFAQIVAMDAHKKGTHWPDM
ncbi:hypothetical protein DFJ77DRAFT_450477 [Powellomyces hirtus]|nr:hypothetical protein DFJ77DRAFT_450477 [Powellomyces hirtus]